MSELVAGIDVGSSGTKCVLLDEAGNVRGSGAVRTLPGFDAVARAALDAALADARVPREDVVYVAVTGLGRASVPWRQVQVTDVTSVARGVHRLLPGTRFVLDVGAQTTRAIRLHETGKVADFHVNEKCAAGSGGFIERAARYLEVKIDDVGPLSLASKSIQPISSVCAVLAESEIVNHVSEGRAVPDILRGIHASLAECALGMLRRVGISGPVALAGGVTRQAGMIAALRDVLPFPVLVPERPELASAVGAAVLGWQRRRKVAGTSARAMA